MDVENVINNIKSLGFDARRHLGNAVVVSPEFLFNKDKSAFDPCNCCWIIHKNGIWTVDIYVHNEIVILKRDEQLKQIFNTIVAYYELSELFEGGMTFFKRILLQLQENDLSIEINAHRNITLRSKYKMFVIFGEKSDEWKVNIYKDKQVITEKHECLDECLNKVLQLANEIGD